MVGGSAQVWSRPLSNGDVAVALYNKNSTTSLNITCTMTLVGFAKDTRVRVRDVFAHSNVGVHVGTYTGNAVPLHGVNLLRFSVE